MQKKTRGGITVAGLFLVIFFYYVKFEIIKLHTLYKAVTGKAGLRCPLKILNRRVKPNGYLKVKLKACFFQSAHDFVSARFGRKILDGSVL